MVATSLAKRVGVGRGEEELLPIFPVRTVHNFGLVGVL